MIAVHNEEFAVESPIFEHIQGDSLHFGEPRGQLSEFSMSVSVTLRKDYLTANKYASP